MLCVARSENVMVPVPDSVTPVPLIQSPNTTGVVVLVANVIVLLVRALMSIEPIYQEPSTVTVAPLFNPVA